MNPAELAAATPKQLLDALLRTEEAARLLCVANALVLALIAIPFAREAFKSRTESLFVVPLPPGAPQEHLDLRAEMRAAAAGLLLFVALYVARAFDPHRFAPWYCPWSVTVDVLVAGGLLRAIGRADRARVRVSRNLPRAQEPTPGQRWLFVAARATMRTLFSRWQPLAVAAAVALLASVAVVGGWPTTEGWGEIVDGTSSVVGFALVALLMGVELTRTEPDPYSVMIVSAWATYAAIQTVSLVSGLYTVTGHGQPLTQGWYWLFIGAALVAKALAMLAFRGLGGLVRYYTPTQEHQIATEGMVAAGRLGNLLAHQTSHVLGRFAARLRQATRAVRHERALPRPLTEALSEMKADLELLTLALDAHRALRGDVREATDCDLDRELDSLCRVLQRDWTDVHIAFEPSGGLRALISRAALVNVVFNLIDNARNALRSAERPAPGTIRVFATLQGDRVCIVVENDGPQVAEAKRAALFHYPTPGQVGGMGLWACQMLLQQWGGSLRLLEGSENTAFALDLPRSREEVDSAGSAEEHREGEEGDEA